MWGWVITLLSVSTLMRLAQCRITKHIYWDKYNEIFRESNDDHKIHLALKDEIQFHCPLDSNFTHPSEGFYIIYRVPKEYYDSCSLPLEVENHKLKNFGIRRVLTCKDPSRKKLFSTVLESFIPLPGSHGGLSFQPGSTYYFISTSSGTVDGIDNRHSSGSSCRKDNMRMQLDVTASRRVDRLSMRQYSSTSTRRITPTANAPYVWVRTPPTQLRRHNNGLQMPKNSRQTAGYSSLQEKTTTAVERKKYPLAIINAGVTLKSFASSSTNESYNILVIIFCLLSLHFLHHTQLTE
ncbi:ephrin-4-like [Watersipora subatra]|uniref:ephrin-4-like n=1 Tax=Watersipora subatra TaxID=2589382 RepID=UPI00355BC787